MGDTDSMTADQLESEQALVITMERNTATLQKLIQKRDAYRDALEKIQATRFVGFNFEYKADRMIEIAEKTLENWK